MPDKQIFVATDFSDAAETAINFACSIAGKAGAGITLFHIHDDKKSSDDEQADKLLSLAKTASEEYGIECQCKTVKGSIMEDIPGIASDPACMMMVIGAHGIKGFREKMFGADILKLVKKIPVPVLVVHKESRLSDTIFNTIIAPVGGQHAFIRIVDAIAMLAEIFSSHVYVYSIKRAGDDKTEQMKKNIEYARKVFEDKSISYEYVQESQSMYSVGYAKQTLAFAKDKNACIISIVSVPTREHSYFAEADKQMLLTNEYHIPVLCTSEAPGED